jgi:hypothetical protein
MRYATYFPNEGKLCLMARRKTETMARCLDIVVGVWEKLEVLMIAKGRWFADRPTAVLIKREGIAPTTVCSRPLAALHMPDEQFLLNFPKGMHATMKAVAKRNKVSRIAEIFHSAHQEVPPSEHDNNFKEWFVYLNDGWDSFPGSGIGIIHETSIKQVCAMLKAISPAKE